MRRTFAALLLLTIVAAQLASACPSCYGAQDSPMTAGMNTAILVMLGIVGSVLASFIAFFVYLWRRNRRRLLAERLQEQPYTKNNEGIVEWNSI